MEFGKRLREVRKKAGLTQETLGQRVGLTRTSITNIEAGRQPVNLELLYRLAAAVQLEPAGLLPQQSKDIAGLVNSSRMANSRSAPFSPDADLWINQVLARARLGGHKR
jgi:transcriptional regulator with XRE-family HTH domain